MTQVLGYFPPFSEEDSVETAWWLPVMAPNGHSGAG
jgi:hypothetical protein